uniref:Uncharacterized protein n=1 Tax=Ursus americanus TaxID=9643 RepID=A0A452R2B4_URSAM
MVLKAVTGKVVEGWWEAGRGVSLGLFCPNTVETRDRSEGPLGVESSRVFRAPQVISM